MQIRVEVNQKSVMLQTLNVGGVIVQSFFKHIPFYVTHVQSFFTLVNPTKSTKPKLIKPSLVKLNFELLID